MSTQAIVTDRLIITPIAEEHFPDFIKMDQDPEIMKFIRAASKDDNESRERFNRYFTYREKNPGKGTFAVLEKESKNCIGLAFFIQIEMNPDQDKHEIGYRLLKDHWGKGYATEITRAMIKYGFEELKLKEIYGTTHPDHVLSQNALKKAGLTYIGEAPYHGVSKVFRIVN